MIALIIYFVGVGIVLATLIYYWFLDNRSITLREVMILCLVSLFSWIIIIIALLMYWDERIEKRKLRKRQTVALLIGAVFLLGTTAFTSCEEGGPIHAPMGSGTAPFYQSSRGWRESRTRRGRRGPWTRRDSPGPATEGPRAECSSPGRRAPPTRPRCSALRPHGRSRWNGSPPPAPCGCGRQRPAALSVRSIPCSISPFTAAGWIHAAGL